MKKQLRCNGKLRGVLYSRVSSKEQEEGYSLEAQQALLREYCSRKSIQIVHEFVESETAKESGRRGFSAMVRLVREESLDAIIVEKTDRLYRNLKDRVIVDDLNIELHLVKEGEIISKASKSHAKFIHDIKLVVSKNYIDNLSEETRKGMLQKARQGIYPTKAPLGYLNVARCGRRVIELDPIRAPLVRQVFATAAEGKLSLQQLTRFAFQLGLRSKKGYPLAKGAIATILKNPAYHGLIIWAGEKHAGTYEPLIQREVFETVNSILAGRNRNNAGYGQKDFAFRGLLTCGYCGCALTAELKKGRYVYYHCTGNRGDCPMPYLREERLTGEFAKVLDSVKVPDHIVEWVAEELAREAEQSTDQVQQRKSRLAAEEKKLLTRLEKLYVDYSEERVGAEIYESLRTKTVEELSSIRAAIAGCSPGYERKPVDASDLFELAKTASNTFKLAPSGHKREIIGALCSNSNVTADGVQVSLREPFHIVAQINEKARLNGLKEAPFEEWLPH